MRAPRGLLLVALLGVAAAAGATPTIRTCGLHLVPNDGSATRWLGPGGHPAWSPDGAKLFVEAHHGRSAGAPVGPIYTVDVATGAARAIAQNAPLGCVRPSPDGRLLAALLIPEGGADGFVTVLDALTGRTVVAPRRLGPAGPRLVDAFAWGADGALLHTVHGAADDPAAGLWEVAVASGEARRLAAGAAADGVWPAPDGLAVAVRLGEQVAVLRLDDPSAPTALAWPQREGTTVEGLAWQEGSLWLQTTELDGPWVQRRTVAGEVLAGWPLPGSPESRVGFGGERAYLVTRRDDQAALVALNLQDGEAAVLAQLAPGVPVRPHEAWPAPAPAQSPDGTRLVLSLGRTDRWGIVDRDKVETTDTNVAGRVVKVVRRLRNVGPSGVVFQSSDCRFAGRARPRADGPVPDDTRPGTMRWSRPSPPRWVVLHHTATRSDGGSLNALTSPSEGRLARLYEDLTPGSWILPEPGTIGVHYLILRSGTVLQLAEERFITRHAGTGQWRNTGPIYDFNSETIGLEIVGLGNDFTAGQVRNVGRLVADICRRQEIPLRHVLDASFREGVIYHRDFAGGLRGKPDPAGWPWATMMQHAQAWLAAR